MIISFDLDDTLICYDDNIPAEENCVPWYWRYFYKDPLRLGTVELMSSLIKDGWSIAIYTTSFRSTAWIKKYFGFYGIPIVKAVNQKIHLKEVVGQKKIPLPSKYPSTFGFHLHVDDQKSFHQIAAQYGFDVIVVSPTDKKWTEKVLAKARQIKVRNSQ